MLLGATLEYIRNEDKSPVFLKYSKLTDEPMMHSKSTRLGASLLSGFFFGCKGQSTHRHALEILHARANGFSPCTYVHRRPDFMPEECNLVATR
jgi:hypothetical protein